MRNENGEIYTVRYEAVNAMLLNEFLKELSAIMFSGSRSVINWAMRCEWTGLT